MIIFAVVSFVTALVAVIFQKIYYSRNIKQLEEAKDFFLSEGEYQLLTTEECKSKLISTDVENPHLKKLLEELNKYIKHNEGTTDFSVIQNKAERYSTSILDGATSNLAFPTYIGLMGTFAGVLLGLVGFEWPEIQSLFMNEVQSAADEGDNISKLVQGVIVSMLTSLIGLVLTTHSNDVASRCKKEMEERKNLFYDFIQNELMPSLGTSVVSALNDLKETLGHFHESFDVVTDKFEETFNGCTERFGEKFKENIDAISEATEKLGHSIDAVNENVEHQKELLRELRSNGMINALDKFIIAGKQFETATCSMSEINVVREKLSESTTELIKLQEDYMSSLVVPKFIAERLNNILNRISTFEDSVNALGTTIQQTQMIGNSEINLINEHLDIIRKKNSLAQEFLESADDKLQELYGEQVDLIGKLNDKYSSAIAEHIDALDRMLEDVVAEIERKKDAFMVKLEDAFDVAKVDSQFKQLDCLPLIKDRVQTIGDTFVNKETFVHSSQNILEQITTIKEEVSAQGQQTQSYIGAVNEGIKSIDTTSNVINQFLLTKSTELFECFEKLKTVLLAIQSNGDNLETQIKSSRDNLIQYVGNAHDDIVAEVSRNQDVISNHISSKHNELNNVLHEVAEGNTLKIDNSINSVRELIREIKTILDKTEEFDKKSIEELQSKLKEQSQEIDKLIDITDKQTESFDNLKIDDKLKDVIASVKGDISELNASLTQIKSKLKITEGQRRTKKEESK